MVFQAEELAAFVAAAVVFVNANWSAIGNVMVVLLRGKYPGAATAIRRFIPAAVALARPEIPSLSEQLLQAVESDDFDSARRIAVDLRAAIGKPDPNVAAAAAVALAKMGPQ